jgi:23S rRNA pseudouridine2605 synthase
MSEERLQKIISRAGVTSRRKAEKLMAEGRVTVNGKAVTELGSKADLDKDHVKVDGKLLRAPKNLVYLALNKPKNCVTTASDPEGRETVMDLMRGLKVRVYPVGRLDYHSEGLLLLTNDGEFANRITSAVHGESDRPSHRGTGRGVSQRDLSPRTPHAARIHQTGQARRKSLVRSAPD